MDNTKENVVKVLRVLIQRESDQANWYIRHGRMESAMQSQTGGLLRALELLTNQRAFDNCVESLRYEYLRDLKFGYLQRGEEDKYNIDKL